MILIKKLSLTIMDFSIDHLNEIIIFSVNYILARDLFQASVRIRNLKDNLMRYYIRTKDCKY